MKRRELIAFGISALAMTKTAHARPPDPASEDAQQMEKYADKVGHMWSRSNGTICCTKSDCRPADAWRISTDPKTGNAFFEVFIRRLDAKGSGWEDGPDRWMRVPDAAVIHNSDVPQPIACWSATYRAMAPDKNGFFCFTPGDGV